MPCAHDGFHTGQGHYDLKKGRVRYVMICDECAQVVSEVHEETYVPKYDPNGNDEFLEAA